jgi:hypothetical protein
VVPHRPVRRAAVVDLVDRIEAGDGVGGHRHKNNDQQRWQLRLRPISGVDDRSPGVLRDRIASMVTGW